jgi:excisionase family DNA binding protein
LKQQMTDLPEVMDIRAAARYLGVSRETLYKYISGDKIPAFKLGSRWRFKKTILDRWMERRSTKGEQRFPVRSRAASR